MKKDDISEVLVETEIRQKACDDIARFSRVALLAREQGYFFVFV